MKRAPFACVFLLVWFPVMAATTLRTGVVDLDYKAVMESTAALKQFDDPPTIAGKLTSVGGGVTTMLIHRWASEFSTLHPEAELDIQGGGSVEGMTNLFNGQADIVPMTRALSADEIARYKTKFGYEPAQVVIAQDAVAVYVNKDNPLVGLTLAQLEAIFSRTPPTGAVVPEFWSDLGVSGPLAKERIARVSLSRVHGSNLVIQDEVMHGADYRFDVRFEMVPSSLVQAVGADPATIGCASVMFATDRSRVVPLQAADSTWVVPSYENTVSGRYPLVRPLRVIFHRKPDGTMNPVAREFLRFAVSRRGQRIIALADSYPLTFEQQQQALKLLGE